MENWIAVIRHGVPCIDPAVPATDWHLSDEGRQGEMSFAGRVKQLCPSVVICSPELKARETAQLLYPEYSVEIDEDLREQGLGQVPFLSPQAFVQALKDCFDQPSEAILGGESAQSAAQRLHRAITRLRRHPAVVVSHGRIISAYVSTLASRHGLRIWQALRMPDVLLVDPSGRRVRRMESSFP